MTEMLASESNVMPVEVRRAIGVLWLSLLAGFVAGIVEDWNRPSPKGVDLAVFIQIFVYGLWAFLIWKISLGSRWARVTWFLLFSWSALAAVFFALGFLGGSKSHANPFNSHFSAAISVVQIALQSYATVLLFSRAGGTWFLRKR